MNSNSKILGGKIKINQNFKGINYNLAKIIFDMGFKKKKRHNFE